MNISRSRLDKVARIYSRQQADIKEKQEIKKYEQNEHYTDKVSFSKDAKQAAKAIRLAKNSDGIRHDKIKNIKRQIQNGTYNIDGQHVAQKIMDDCLLNKLQ